MDRKDIVSYLKSFVKRQRSEVNYGTYKEIPCSSLLNDGLATRANSVWKQSQFVVAYRHDGNEPEEAMPYLKGWAELTRGVHDQYLLLECPASVWTVYDNKGRVMQLDELKHVSQKPAEAPADSLLIPFAQTTRTTLAGDSPFRPYVAAIKSKPFILLAGISGTGKSRMVRELARACWDEGTEEFAAQKPRNFEMIQVRPDWHDSHELIGYVSRVSGQPVYVAGEMLKFMVKAWAEENTPYFLCLDEMNLAPVEQYMAEYLSVIESRKRNAEGKVVTDPILKPAYMKERDGQTYRLTPQKWYKDLVDELLAECPDDKADRLARKFLKEGISVPQNLIVVGTVNMDESTFSFSRKVLDRAMTIEMNYVDLDAGLTTRYEPVGKLGKDELIGTAVEGADVYLTHKIVCDKALAYLKTVNAVLEGTPFKVAYRTRNEFLLYVVHNLPYDEDGAGRKLKEDYVLARALDEVTSMKILSRIEGDDTKVTDGLLDRLGKVVEDGLGSISDSFVPEQSVSLAKLEEMKGRLASGYTSFWT